MNLILRDVEETYSVLVRVCRELPARALNAPFGAGAADEEGAPLPPQAAAAQAAAPEAGMVQGGQPSGGAAEAAASAAIVGTASAAGKSAAARSSQPSEGGRVRWGRKQDVRRRTLKQVFVRGDNIVLVSLVAAGGQPA